MGNSQSQTGGDLSFDLSSPSTPFTQPIGTGGLKVGKTMFIEGEAISQGKKDHFEINFDADDRQRDVVFHCDVRFWKNEQHVMVLNNKLGKWQVEERLQNPFQQKQPFRIDIEIGADGFIIANNKGLPYTFKYRIRPERVAQIRIEGQVKINRIFYGYPPTSSPSQPPRDPIQSPPNPTYQAPPNPIYHAPPPAYQAPPSVTSGSLYGGSVHGSYPSPGSDGGYSAPGMTQAATPHVIHGGMYIGRQVVVYGIPNANAKRFNIDLHGHPGNIALHLSVRFDENAVVRNSLRSNQWENEERHASSFPFKPDQPFQIQILCDHVGYKIAVNGQHFTEFVHRIEASTVQSVVTGGDMSSVNVQIF